MDREEYTMMAKMQSKIPPTPETPKGQKFHIGEVVKISNPESWFAKDSFKKDKNRLYEMEYSYNQKYRDGNDYKDGQRVKYSLIHLFEDNSSAWFSEDELELVKGIKEITEEKELAEYKRLKAKFGDNIN